jgi:hypothetical protein
MEVMLTGTAFTPADGPPPSPVVPGCNLTDGNAIFAGMPFVIVLFNDTGASFASFDLESSQHTQL